MVAALVAYGVASTVLLAWAIKYGVPFQCQQLEADVRFWERRLGEANGCLRDRAAAIASRDATIEDARETETRLRQQLAQAVAKLHEAHTATEWPV